MRGGINVAPILIENQLGLVEGVDDVAVVGVPHKIWGEMIVACVIASDRFTAQDVRPSVLHHAGKRLDPNLRPDRVITKESFPRASTGKVQKHLLRGALASEGVDEAEQAQCRTA